MEFLKIKETCLYITDLEKARRFYHDVLGLPVINYTVNKHLFLRVGESVLLLFNAADSKNKKSPPAHYGGGKQHFAFEVEERLYESAKQEILSKGIEIIDTVTWPSQKESFYFNDPEGNVLEILPSKAIWD
jgi:catechol 2,3-dioxygenase-like lactoylglutathione lyase family enzyme